MKVKECGEEWENVRKWWRFKEVFIGENGCIGFICTKCSQKTVKKTCKTQ